MTVCVPVMQPMYLGKPGAMQNLGLPQAGYNSTGGRGEAVHPLINGGTAVTRVPKTKRLWQIPAATLTEDAVNQLLAFYAGTMGRGPFVLVDPAWRNKLGDDVSTMGAVKQAITGWSTLNAGALAWDGTDTPPLPESDIMTWTGAGNTSKITVGTWSGSSIIPRTAEAPPYLGDMVGEAAAGSVYLRTATGTASLSVTCLGLDGAGGSASGSATTATISSAGWTRLTNFAPAGISGMKYVGLQVACNTSSAPVIWVAAADIQFGPTSLATLQPWVVGLGSPRVILVPSSAASSGAWTATTNRFPYRDQAFALAEV